MLKKVITKLEILTHVEYLIGFLTGVLTSVCPFVSFSNSKGMNELWK